MQYLGRYELLGEIAAGGMAAVYLGRVVGEGGFEREVAIKVMHEHLAQDPEFVAMFLDEARLAARIRHPNVVATLDVQRTDQGMFLVMDFIEGLSLAAMLKQLKARKQLLPYEVTLRVLIDTLQGLHAAHELTDRDGSPLCLVHRDVSPANVLVGTDGVSRLTDFGVARAETRITSTRGGQVKGKLQYMPPEQITADAVDRRADVYAVGAVLWECLTGKRLFDAKHEGALLQQVLAGSVRRPSELNPTVPAAIEAICLAALSVSPDGRYATAAQMADSLDAAAVSAGIRVATVSQLAAFVKQFDTNANRIDDARKSAPGLRPDLLLESVGVRERPGSFSQSRSGLFGATPSGVGSTPGSGSGVLGSTSAVIPSTSTSAVIPSGMTGVRELDMPHARRTLFIGLAAGVIISAVVVGAFMSGKLSSDRTDAGASGAGSPPSASVTEQPVATAAATDSAAASATATVDAAAAPSTSASATASATAVAGPRPGAGGTGKTPGKGSSAADFLPGTL